MDLSTHYELIISQFKHLEHALALLDKQIRADSLTVWIENDKQQFVDDKDLLIAAFKRLAPDFDKSAQETFSCFGAVAATPAVVAAVREVNKAKDAFKAACASYNQTKPVHSVHHVLKLHKVGPISLKHAYRHIRILLKQPTAISWTLTRNSSNRVITALEAKKRLLKMGENEAIMIQLKRLSELGPKEKLVIRREMKPYGAVNISFRDPSGNLVMEKIHTSLPVLFLNDQAMPLPEVRLSSPRKALKRARSDKKVDDTPFLPSISAYRYK